MYMCYNHMYNEYICVIVTHTYRDCYVYKSVVVIDT